MSEHRQMQPPDYHRCLEIVFSSPAASREILERLSKMTEAEVQSRWSPWVSAVLEQTSGLTAAGYSQLAISDQNAMCGLRAT